MKLNLSYRYRSQLFDFLYVQIEQYGAFAFDSLTMDDADRLLETACEIAEVTAEEFEVTDLVIGLIGWSVLLEGASTGYEDLEHAIEPILKALRLTWINIKWRFSKRCCEKIFQWPYCTYVTNIVVT